MTDLLNPIFQDSAKAREHLESIRWAEGRFCPHCGETENTSPVRGKSHRPGLYYCNGCKKQFTVTIGTIFERSKIPLNKWLLAFHLMASSKKGISAHQLHRMLGITYKSAWFMAHRIREAMRNDSPDPIGGKGKIVEADETFYGNSGDEFINDKGWRKKRGLGDKSKIVTFVERDGAARSTVVDRVHPDSFLMTDEAGHYRQPGKKLRGHYAVNHAKNEYAKGFITTNTVEGFFSIFKRGMNGVYQHCGEQHVHRYLSEFDFRYTYRKVSDRERADLALKGAEGKRLVYHQTSLKSA
jgi:transposase-like protein